MRSSMLFAAAVATTAILAPAPAGAVPPHGGRVAWTQDVEAGMAQARRTGRPMMVYFTAEW